MAKKNTKKPDKSLHVHQKEKISYELHIRELPWTPKQKQFIELANDKNNKIFFIEGPAGSSKTMLSMYSALKKLNEHFIGEIVLVRSAIESADNSLGFLPGSLGEKYGVYTTPFFDKVEELLPPSEVKKLQDDGRLVLLPVNFARGLHLAAKYVIIDEAQNLTKNEIKTLLTRIGPFTKYFICYDPSQSDLPPNKRGGIDAIASLFSDEESKKMGIVSFKFEDEDIVRSEICKFIVGKFKQLQ